METPTLYIVNSLGVKPRVESFRLKPKRVRYRFTRRIPSLPTTGSSSSGVKQGKR
jgi:hypothetical protein